MSISCAASVDTTIIDRAVLGAASARLPAGRARALCPPLTQSIILHSRTLERCRPERHCPARGAHWARAAMLQALAQCSKAGAGTIASRPQFCGGTVCSALRGHSGVHRYTEALRLQQVGWVPFVFRRILPTWVIAGFVPMGGPCVGQRRHWRGGSLLNRCAQRRAMFRHALPHGGFLNRFHMLSRSSHAQWRASFNIWWSPLAPGSSYVGRWLSYHAFPLACMWAAAQEVIWPLPFRPVCTDMPGSHHTPVATASGSRSLAPCAISLACVH